MQVKERDIVFSLPLLLDGAMGSQLMRAGMPSGSCVERWAAEHPQTVVDVQRRYVEAGAQALYCPTFLCNRHSLGGHGLADRTEEYNETLVALSRQASEGRALLLGDMAPPALMLKPLGTVDYSYLYDVYAEQVLALERAGVDGYIIETVMTVAEARAILRAVKDHSDKPVLVTFTVGENGRTPLSGADALAALLIMQAMGADAFGLNCSVGPEQMLAQLRRIAPYARVPLIAKPNAGTPEIVDGRAVYRCPPEEFARCVQPMAECGVRLFGGCCGTDERHLAAMRDEMAKIDFASLPLPERRDCALALCTEKDAVLYDAMPEIVWYDDPEDADECPEGALPGLRLNSEEAIDAFLENASCFAAGVCLSGDDDALLERAVREYPGLVCCPADGASKECLEKLQREYGARVIGS